MLCNDSENVAHLGCYVMTVHTSVLHNTLRDFFLWDFFFFQDVFYGTFIILMVFCPHWDSKVPFPFNGTAP